MNNHGFPRVPFVVRNSPRQNRSTPYSYIPLGDSTHKIRLLKLLPGNLGDDIHVKLSTRTLTKIFTPTYEALSYAWGSVEDPTSIYIGKSKDYVLSVTRNLACALDHLRLKDKCRTLWMDAICVNQQNPEERSQQVGRMADVYRMAERVVVWLGPEKDDSSLAMDVLRTIGTNVEVDWFRRLMKPSKKAEIGGETHWSDRSIILPFKRQDGVPMHNLLNRSWFERLWIQQEISLASPGAIVMCGLDTIPWSDFRKAVFCLQHKNAPVGYFRDKIKFKSRLRMIYRISDKQYLFGKLMRKTQDCKYSDPRDRVYALLSMYHKNLHIVPNYRLSKQEVYQDLCLRLIALSKYRNLDMLRWCEMPTSPSDLPTWVPDWSISNTSVNYSTNRASGTSAANVQYLGGGVLRAKGVKVANVVLADEIPFYMSTNGAVALIRRFAPADLDLNGEVFDTYCRTLCSNLFRDVLDPPATHYPSREKGKEALRFFLGPQGGMELVEPLNLDFHIYVNQVRNVVKGRSFLSTDQGHFGLGPKGANPKDDIVVFAGCDSPIVLRLTDNGRYKVIGQCFIDNLSHSEGLLGPLPEGYQQILKYDERKKEAGMT